jgi:GTP-binding protein
LSLVDLPGYGYAAAPSGRAREWGALVEAYLRGRKMWARWGAALTNSLACTFVLVDARRGILDADRAFFDFLADGGVNFEAPPPAVAADARRSR